MARSSKRKKEKVKDAFPKMKWKEGDRAVQRVGFQVIQAWSECWLCLLQTL